MSQIQNTRDNPYMTASDSVAALTAEEIITFGMEMYRVLQHEQ